MKRIRDYLENTNPPSPGFSYGQLRDDDGTQIGSEATARTMNDLLYAFLAFIQQYNPGGVSNTDESESHSDFVNAFEMAMRNQPSNIALPSLLTGTQYALSGADDFTVENYGSAIAIGDDYLFIGADRAAHASTPAIRSGAVFVYRKIGTTWSFDHSIQPPSPDDDERFGGAIAYANGLLYIGSWNKTRTSSQSGSVSLYLLTGGTWTHARPLLRSGPGLTGAFGRSIAAEEDLVAVGAPRESTNGLSQSGAAYIYELQGGNHIQLQRIEDSVVQQGAEFGSTVSLSGTHLAISAPLRHIGALADAGTIEIYERQAATFTRIDTYEAPTSSNGAEYGRGVDIHGDLMAIGAPLHDADGAVFLYEYVGGVWSLITTLRSPDRRPSRFGQAVSILGAPDGTNRIICGANSRLIGATSIGSAHVFSLGTNGWTQSGELSPIHTIAGQRFGNAIASDGADILIAAPLNDAVYCFVAILPA